MRTLAKNTVEQIGQELMVMGWVNSRRDHGGLIFIDLRDESGIVQLTCTPDDAELFETTGSLRDEFVIKATGTVKERGPDLVNPNIETGKIEIAMSELTILNESEVLPFQIGGDSNVGEETRLKYRYLDLRREKMQTMLKKRNDFNQSIHKYMQEKDFTEIVTPILANSSPEGARDYLVPSRLHPGKFYALPQAPQQFKQLLMVGGIPRYYQIAPCFRDEDPRADRHPGEFYQLDLEMAFVEDGQEVRDTMQPLIVDLVTNFGDKQLAHEVLTLTYEEVMNKYGTDKPDLRFNMELIDLTEELKACEFGVFTNAIKDRGAVKAICVKDGAKLSRAQIDKFTEVAKQAGAGGLPYMSIEAGEVKSPIAKFFNDDELKTIVDKTNANDGDSIFFGSDKLETVNGVLGKLRNAFADHFELRDPEKISLLWVVDFPYYELNEVTNKPDFGHNPFSMPKSGLEGLNAPDSELLKIVADQYDMVANGYEVCSGAIRNHNPEIMYKAFENLGFDKSYVDKKFGAMISAFKFGAPPHGGCAFGLDRLFMVLMDEPNIREVIAFPKNGSAVDVMSNSPSTVDEDQLKDLSISVIDNS